MPSLSLKHRVREPNVSTPGARPPLLILLHGVGSNEISMASLAGAFDPRFVVISARSPIQLGQYSFGWWHVQFTPNGPVIDPTEAAAAWKRAAEFIDETVEAYETDPQRVYLAGFSQGGIMSLATMLTAPDKLAGAVCMSGRLLMEVLPQAAPPDRLRGKPVLIVHGTHDEKLGPEYGRAAHEKLLTFPLEVTYQEFPMTHTTTAESVAFVSSWLTARLDEL
jgi:phospholipase/carboxylesterase